jgi:hypothetical protein
MDGAGTAAGIDAGGGGEHALPVPAAAASSTGVGQSDSQSHDSQSHGGWPARSAGQAGEPSCVCVCVATWSEHTDVVLHQALPRPR